MRTRQIWKFLCLSMTAGLAFLAGTPRAAQEPISCACNTSISWNEIVACPSSTSTFTATLTSVNCSGGEDCALSATITISGKCTDASVSGNWGVYTHSGATRYNEVTTGISNLSNIPSTSQSTSTAGSGFGCDPSKSRGLTSLLYEGAYNTGTLRNHHDALYTCVSN